MKFISCDYDDSDYKVIMTEQEFNRHRNTYWIEETSVSDGSIVNKIPCVWDTEQGDQYEVIIEDNTFETYPEMDSNFNGRG